MDQKPPQSSDTPPAGTPNSAPASPPQENTQQPSTPPVDHPAEHSTIPAPTNPEQSPSTPEQSTAPSAPTATVSASEAPTPPLVPGAPGDPVHKKSHTMMYAVVTLVIVLIGAGLVTMMSMNQEAQPGVNTTVAQPTQAPAPTEVPTVIPSPSTPEEEVEAVNVTENDADLQEVEKDLQAL